MKVISKTKDYYDAVFGYTGDQSTTYHRTKQVIEVGRAHSLLPILEKLFAQFPYTGFISLMDPFRTHQEIEMFLNGILGKNDPAPRTVGSDKVIAFQKGFDDNSFRNVAPSARKERRKLNRARKQGIPK